MLGAMLLLASLASVGFARQAQEKRPRWEYHTACGQTDLNRVGEDGWELTAATQNGNITCLYFKRRK